MRVWAPFETIEFRVRSTRALEGEVVRSCVHASVHDSTLPSVYPRSDHTLVPQGCARRRRSAIAQQRNIYCVKRVYGPFLLQRCNRRRFAEARGGEWRRHRKCPDENRVRFPFGKIAEI